MIGYVILVAAAIGLSTAVFFYLKLYLPSENPKCYEDIDLVFENVTCRIVPNNAEIFVNFTNRGLFNVDTAYIKFGEADRVVRTILNDPPEQSFLSSDCNNLSNKLKPGEYFCKTFNYNSQVSIGKIYEVSVEPMMWIDNTPVLCPDSIVTKKIMCL